MIEFRIQGKTRSLNTSLRGGWQPRYRATKRERNKAMRACPKWPGGPTVIVRLTRVSPGVLDQANLAGALKHVQDGVASRLKVDDASPLVQWIFEQAKGEAEVVVQIWKDGEDSPPLPVGRPVDRNRSMVIPKVSAFDQAVNKRLRAPRPAYAPPLNPKGMGMHLYKQEHPGPIKRAAMERAKNEAPVPRGSRTNPMATKSVVMSAEDSAIHRAVLAAEEAEATFAPPTDRPVNHPQWCECVRCRLGDGE